MQLNTTNISLLSHRQTVSSKDIRKDFQTLREDTRRQNQTIQEKSKMAQFQSLLSLWATAFLVILWFTVVFPRAEGHELTAYDCDQPRIIDRLRIPVTGDCHSIPEASSNLTQSWSLLQSVRHKEVTGYRCQLIQTTLKFECGMFSHLSMLAAPMVEVPVPLPATTCETMAERNLVTVGGADHHISLDTELILHLDQAGLLISNSQSVSCQGVTEVVGETVAKDALILVQRRYKLTEVKLKVRRQQMAVLQTSTLLPCRLAAEQCVLPAETYIWNGNLEHSCLLYYVKTLTGSLTPWGKSNDYMLEDTRNKIRLRVRPKPSTHCGISVRQTNYKQLLLTQDTIDPEIISPVPSDRIDIPTYVRSRDDFISGMITHASEASRHQFTAALCRQNPLLLIKTPLPTTNKGTFMYQLGDTFIYITCPEIQVRAREVDTCSQQFPVYQGEKPRYLEPVTHILTNHYVSAPCQPLLPRPFLTTESVWIAQSPSLHTVPSPRELTASAPDPTQPIDLSTDVGVYSNLQAQMSFDSLNYEGFHQALMSSITTSVCRQHNPDLPCPTTSPQTQDYFESLTHVPTVQGAMKNYLSRFMKFLNIFGEVCSITVVIYILLGVLRTIVTYLCSLTILIRRHRNCNLVVCCKAIPEIFLYTHHHPPTPDPDPEPSMNTPILQPPTNPHHSYYPTLDLEVTEPMDISSPPQRKHSGPMPDDYPCAKRFRDK